MGSSWQGINCIDRQGSSSPATREEVIEMRTITLADICLIIIAICAVLIVLKMY